jgi:2'-5' RNA ligase
MLKPRSAVIVALPIPPAIEAIRRAHVPVAELGVPPHVTILSPFVPADNLQPPVRRRLQTIAANTRAFEVTFSEVEHFPDALYLAPSPDEPFRRLSVEVVKAFPGFPPYGNPSYRPEEGLPHLTIAMANGASFVDLGETAALHLPFRCTARFLTVVSERPDGRWQVRWRVPLGPKTRPST